MAFFVASILLTIGAAKTLSQLTRSPRTLNFGSATVMLNGGAATPASQSLTSLRATSSARIALVQHTSRDAGTSSSATLAFNSNTTAGDWIGVCVRAGAVRESFTVTDSNGNRARKQRFSQQWPRRDDR
jgi:hypothetical protein